MEGKFSSACEAISFLAARILVTIKKGLQGPFSLEIDYLSIAVLVGSVVIGQLAGRFLCCRLDLQANSILRQRAARNTNHQAREH